MLASLELDDCLSNEKCYDFSSGNLNIYLLAEYQLPNPILHVCDDIPVNFESSFKPRKIRPGPNSCAVYSNKQVVVKVISAVVAPGHVSPASERSSILSFFNVMS